MTETGFLGLVPFPHLRTGRAGTERSTGWKQTLNSSPCTRVTSEMHFQETQMVGYNSPCVSSEPRCQKGNSIWQKNTLPWLCVNFNLFSTLHALPCGATNTHS